MYVWLCAPGLVMCCGLGECGGCHNKVVRAPVSFSHRWNMTASGVDVRCGGNSRTVQEGAAGGFGAPGHLVWGRKQAHTRKHSAANPATQQQQRTTHDASQHAGACGRLPGIHDARFQGE